MCAWKLIEGQLHNLHTILNKHTGLTSQAHWAEFRQGFNVKKFFALYMHLCMLLTHIHSINTLLVDNLTTTAPQQILSIYRNITHN